MATLTILKTEISKEPWVILKEDKETKTVSWTFSLPGGIVEFTFGTEHLQNLIDSVKALEEFEAEEIKKLDPAKDKQKIAEVIQASKDRESLLTTGYALKNLAMAEVKAAADVIVNPSIVDPSKKG